MINNYKILAIVPARGGSKGIPRKNIKMLIDKPLIAWTIEEAKKSKFIDKLIVSTDDTEIAKISKEWGAEVPFLRPAELAQDDTPGIDPILHALEYFPEYEYIVVLQPTSPLRLAKDIDGAIDLCVKNNHKFCVSVAESKAIPEWMFHINEQGILKPIINNNFPYQRQKAKKPFLLNGAVYVGQREALLKNRSFLSSETIAYLMPKDRSIDIDDINDFEWCEFFLRNKNVYK